MKKITLIFVLFVAVMPMWLMGQTGFWSDDIAGDYDRINLNNTTLTTLGTTVSHISAADMDDDGDLYAIRNSNNGFYKIDTADGTATFIGTCTPLPDHNWTGMDFDYETQTMYAMCTKGGSSGESSLHTINLVNGQPTLVGSQNTAKSIACIASNGDGQLYGIDESTSSKLYEIDKSDGSATFVANLNIPMAGMGHGMDWNASNSTMYLATYNSIYMTNSLRTVDLNMGVTVEVGSLPAWTGLFVANNTVTADFSSDITSVCKNNQVHFTDQSTGANTWHWTFEGGIPSTSALQNPVVLYKTPGDYDVSLKVSNGLVEDSISHPDYIHVMAEPASCGTPEGETKVCNDATSEYTSSGSPDADSYVWEIYPAEAGIVTSNNLDASVDWNGGFSGTAYLSLYGINSCGEGVPSDSLAIEVDDCTFIDENMDSFMVSVSPSPAHNVIVVSSNAEMSEVVVFNSMGKQVLLNVDISKTIRLNVSHLPIGIYVVKVKTNGGIKALKFLKR